MTATLHDTASPYTYEQLTLLLHYYADELTVTKAIQGLAIFESHTRCRNETSEQILDDHVSVYQVAEKRPVNLALPAEHLSLLFRLLVSSQVRLYYLISSFNQDHRVCRSKVQLIVMLC